LVAREPFVLVEGHLVGTDIVRVEANLCRLLCCRVRSIAGSGDKYEFHPTTGISQRGGTGFAAVAIEAACVFKDMRCQRERSGPLENSWSTAILVFLTQVRFAAQEDVVCTVSAMAFTAANATAR
jgi:hypothetical protein